MSDGASPLRVLHVEDEASARIIVASILQKHGFEVIPAKTLAAGIQAARGSHVDVAVLDLNTGDSAGLDTLNVFTKAFPRTPVVVLTGAHPNVGREAVAQGADDFLVKSEMTPESLVDMVLFTYHRAFRQRNAENETRREARREVVREARHNMATPLTPIALQLDNIRQKLTEHPDTLKFLASIERNVGRLKEELDQFDEENQDVWNQTGQSHSIAPDAPGRDS